MRISRKISTDFEQFSCIVLVLRRIMGAKISIGLFGDWQNMGR